MSLSVKSRRWIMFKSWENEASGPRLKFLYKLPRNHQCIPTIDLAALSLFSPNLNSLQKFSELLKPIYNFFKSNQNSSSVLQFCFNLWVASWRGSKGLTLLLASLISDAPGQRAWGAVDKVQLKLRTAFAVGLLYIRWDAGLAWYQMLWGRWPKCNQTGFAFDLVYIRCRVFMGSKVADQN